MTLSGHVPRGNSSSASDFVSGEHAGFEASDAHAVSGKERYCRQAQEMSG